MPHIRPLRFRHGVAGFLVLGAPWALGAHREGPGPAAEARTDPALPFRDILTGKRFPGKVAQEAEPLGPAPWLKAGFGLPCTFTWRPHPGAEAQLVSFVLGHRAVRQDVTGLASLLATFRNRVDRGSLEALFPLDLTRSRWGSSTLPIKVSVRGLLPFGQPAAGPCFDAVLVPSIEGLEGTRWNLLVTDARSHVVRRVGSQGAISVYCGQSGQPGHLDSPSWTRRLGNLFERRPLPAPLLNGPTYLVARELPGLADPEVLLSDTGNQVIRRLTLDGRVTTLAGVPGMAGHRDADSPGEALFDTPQGIAADDAGNLYLADQGNQVIRVIEKHGRVWTLAGSPGTAGTTDGFQGMARFSRLRGLACRPTRTGGGILYVLDGHALRAVTYPDGAVLTLFGRADQPGFEDLEPGAGAPGNLRPCLRDPAGLRLHQGALYIADTGNHAIRKVDLAGDSLRLRTLLGDPQEPATRWGLLRDGIPAPIGPAYAALGSPSAVVPVPRRWGGPLMTCGEFGLAEIHDRWDLRESLELLDLECVPGAAGTPALVRFRAVASDRRDGAAARTLFYTVHFLGPRDELLERVQVRGQSATPQTAQGTFRSAGKGAVVVQCVTDEGISAGRRLEVTVGD